MPTSCKIHTAFNPGNSGGAVLDDHGNVLGLVSFGEGENLHFAIAVDEISAFLRQSENWQFILREATSFAAQRPTYSTSKAADGRRILRVQFTDLTAYLVLQPDNRVAGLVARSNSGAIVQAWAPDKSGGFNRWMARFTDGHAAEATGRKARPARFSAL